MSPEAIGPYQVLRRLGHGGMGEVLLAYDGRLKRHVALKSLLPAKLSSDSDGYAALLREARAVASLSHNGIASIYDILEERDRSYIVMEYVEGDTLAARLRQGPLSSSDAIDIGVQLCDALSSAHERRIIHRDLKPGNIMLGPGGRAKILDFGLAKHAPADASATTATASSAPVGTMLGTVGYISPEQMTGAPVDHRCDIYSLGVVLFEMFTGRRPFTERDGLSYALAATRGPAPLATDVNASVSPAVAAVIARALSAAPAARYDNAAALARDLRAASAGATITLPETITVTRQPRARRRTGWLAVTAATVIAMLAYVAYPDQPPPAAANASPAVLAVLPVRSLGADEATQAVAAGITATVIANMSGVSGLSVIPLSGVSPYADRAQSAAGVLQKLGAQWLLDLSLDHTSAFTLSATLMQADNQISLWQKDYSGTELSATRQLLDGLGSGLLSAGVLTRLSAADRNRLLTTTTSSNAAFIAYSQGRRWMFGLSEKQDPVRAAEFFTRALEQDPQYALAHAGLADAYWASYQKIKDPALIDRASQAANRALSLDPSQMPVQLALATIFNQTGRTEQALQAADAAIATQPTSDDAFRTRGRILTQAGRFDEAIVALRRAVELRPNYANNHENLGFTLYRAGRLREAADSYRRVTELAPDSSSGYQMLGTTLHLLGDTTQAIGNYEHAVRLGPNASAYSNLAYSYYEVGRFEEALKAYKEAIARDSKSPSFHRNIGDVYARLGQTASARAAYEASIAAGSELVRVRPNDADTIALVALCEAKLGRRAAAERHAAEALALRPKNRDVMVKNAEVYARLNQSERAIDYLQRAIALGYDPAVAARNEEFERLKAVPAFATVIAAAPPSPQR